MPTQLTLREQQAIDLALRGGGAATDVIAQINGERVANGVEPVASSTVYRFIRGVTHARGVPERRGRHAALSKKDIAGLDRARKRLLKRADSHRPVTYQAIQEEAGMLGKCCSRTAQDALRGIGVRFRAPRHKVYWTAGGCEEAAGGG